MIAKNHFIQITEKCGPAMFLQELKDKQALKSMSDSKIFLPVEVGMWGGRISEFLPGIGNNRYKILH